MSKEIWHKLTRLQEMPLQYFPIYNGPHRNRTTVCISALGCYCDTAASPILTTSHFWQCFSKWYIHVLYLWDGTGGRGRGSGEEMEEEGWGSSEWRCSNLASQPHIQNISLTHFTNASQVGVVRYYIFIYGYQKWLMAKNWGFRPH